MLLNLWLACATPDGPMPTHDVETVSQVDGLPLSSPRTADLQSRLREASPASDHATHVDERGRPLYVNRLALESSAYLRQHAHQPVDWFPWSDEAFELAEATGRPVLLSVGYSTCHWCHVMARESFEDEAIAAYINEHFVPIKVDREELPQVDAVYMAATQTILRGNGGWPMTVFLTHERRPFHAATYLPPRDGDRDRSVGLLTVLERMHSAYTDDPERVQSASEELSRLVAQQLAATDSPDELPGPDLLAAARRRAMTELDPVHGGRRGPRKFPSGWPLSFAVDDVARGHHELRPGLVLTLDHMISGGLHDHVGGGFHRYTVDPEWRVPHFEKMLYDNALLGQVYIEAWRHLRDPVYSEVVRGIVLDQLGRRRGGAFASAVDADSPAPGDPLPVEGGYYTFTMAEAHEAFAAAGIEPAPTDALGIGPEGPVDGRSVVGLPDADALLDADIRAALRALGEVRDDREPPFVDTKAVVAWNGLMLSTLARGGRFLDADWLVPAEELAIVLSQAGTEGRLPRVLGQEGGGTLQDEAFVAAGFVDLFEATGDRRWLDGALARATVIEEHFSAPEGGWFRVADDAPELLARPRADHDGAEPSGASVHVITLQRLAALTGDHALQARADQALKAYASPLAEGRLDHMLPAVAWRHGRPLEVVLVAPPHSDHDPVMVQAVDRALPHHHVRILASESHPGQVRGTVATGKLAHGGRTTLYVCEEGVCQAPVTDPAAIERVLFRYSSTP